VMPAVQVRSDAPPPLPADESAEQRKAEAAEALGSRTSWLSGCSRSCRNQHRNATRRIAWNPGTCWPRPTPARPRMKKAANW